MNNKTSLLIALLLGLSSCSMHHFIQKNASNQLIGQEDLKHAYIGIMIYDPERKKAIYEHNASKYFAPASNTKLYSFYTGLNYIGDSTTGIQYQIFEDTLYIRGTGDPSFLHPDFPHQPAFAFLRDASYPIVMTNPVYKSEPFGPGWTWNSFNAYWQPERSSMPLYGNVVRFTVKDDSIHVMPGWFGKNGKVLRNKDIYTKTFYIKREKERNIFHYNINPDIKNTKRIQEIPYIVNKGKTTAILLQDTLHKTVSFEAKKSLPPDNWKTIYNVPLDSLFKHMLYHSDNFFAEQTDQMASMNLFDTISMHRVIHYMLKNKLKDLPDLPRWVDGSGLSRYNLFSPRDMVSILTKLKEEYPIDRIKALLPTGGRGTLYYLYRDMSGYIFAKTGTLSYDIALSGYLRTKKGKELIFSVLINHTIGSLQDARRATERFLRKIWKRY